MKCPTCSIKEMINSGTNFGDEEVYYCLDCGVCVKIITLDDEELDSLKENYKDIVGVKQ